ncbi:MAG: glycosyltransferase family 8 protein [Rickettsiales bacterium]|jgi:lipopolysaccharide biosynthesis glycosyltransferase|nr:glycosyltransferase family 8 protein [Rickettsiales bacterium]
MLNMQKINIAFCFDKNLWRQAAVSITSLLSVSKSVCHYDIYCIVSDDITDGERIQLKKNVRTIDAKSDIHFFTAGDNTSGKKIAHAAGFYFRLQLPKILQNIDKIIYCDVDTVFMQNLLSLWQYDMKHNILCGVKDGLNLKKSWKKYQTKTDKKFIIQQGKYINSGVILINLKKMRNENMYEKFQSMIGEKIRYKDQDILNYTCFPWIDYLPLRYNFIPRASRKYSRMLRENLITKSDITDAKNNPVIYHFMNCNPWKVSSTKSNMWWKYAAITPFYNALKNEYIAQHKILGRIKFVLLEMNKK